MPKALKNHEIRIRGDRLRSAILNQNYTLYEFAEAIDMGSPHLSNIINEKRGCSIEGLYRMAVALNISCDYLLGLTDIPWINSRRGKTA